MCVSSLPGGIGGGGEEGKSKERMAGHWGSYVVLLPSCVQSGTQLQAPEGAHKQGP